MVKAPRDGIRSAAPRFVLVRLVNTMKSPHTLLSNAVPSDKLYYDGQPSFITL